MKKRVLALFMALVMIFSLFSVTTYADVSVSMDVSPKTDVKAGDTIKVSVTLPALTEKISGWEMLVNFSSDKLEYTGWETKYDEGIEENVIDTEMPSAFTVTLQNVAAVSGGTVKAFADSVGKNKTVNGAKRLFTMTFKVKDGASGDATFSISDLHVVQKDDTDLSKTTFLPGINVPAAEKVTFATPTPPTPANQTITAFNVTATYGDKDAKITASTNGDGALSYAVTSGNDVIAVDSNGNLTIKKVGTATVTITAAATANYNEANKNVTVTVNSKKLEPRPITGKQTLIVSYKNEDRFYDGTPKTCTVSVNVKNGPKLTENTDYTVTYDNNVNASKTPSNSRYACFTVTAIEGRNYTWDPYTMDFVIGKATLTITADDVSAALGETGKKIVADTNVDGCNLTYTVTSGADVIDVDNNGNLTIKKAGSAQVTITAAKTDNYETATKVVNVKIVQNPLTGNVRITGETKVGKPLTVDVSDLNETTHLSYQWYRGDVAISNAIGSTYTLTKDDYNKTIKVEVKTTADSNVVGFKTATTDVISCEHTFTGKDTAVATLVTAGTCKDKAVYRYYCVLCDTVDPDENHTFEGEKNPNKHIGGTEVIGQKAATCTEKGYTGDTYCLGCNTKTATGTDIPALGHTLTYTASVVATCKVEGYRDYWHCSKCNNYYADKDAKTELSADAVKPALNPTNHVGGTEVKNKKDATCTENGYTGDTYCKSCGEVITAGSVIPALGHNFKYVDRPNQDGFIKYADLKCTNEGCTVSAKDVDAMKGKAVQATLNIDVFLQCAKAADSGNFTGSGVPFFYQVIRGENDDDIDKVGFPLFTGDFSHRLNQPYTLISGKGSDDSGALANMDLPQREGSAWTVKMVQPDSAPTGWTIDDAEYKVYFKNDYTELVIMKKVEKQIEQGPTTDAGASADPTEPVPPTDPVYEFEAVNEIVFNNIFKVEKKDDPTPPTPTPVIPDGPKHTNRRYPAKPAASTDTKKPDGVPSARTFDAGVALYVGMSVLSLTGTALVIGKKKEF